MAYIGKVPTAVPLGTSDLADSIVTSAKITDGTIALADLSATGTKDATTFLRGDNTFASAGGDNTPAFFVTYSSGQTLNSSASTKLNFDSEVYDTNSAYDNSTNYRFTVPSGQAGKYYIGLNIQFYDQQSRMNRMISMIYLNGTKVRENDDYGTQDKVFGNSTCDTFFDLSVGDYVEAYAFGETGDGGSFAINGGTSNLRSFFGGYKLII